MRAIKAIVLASCALLGGCLEFEQTVTLAADGSGTQQVRLTLREKVIERLEKATPAARLGDGANPRAVFDEKLVGAEVRAAGLELTRHEVTSSDQQRTVDMQVGFADFATLQKSPLCGNAAEWALTRGPKEGTGKLTLYPQGRQAWQEARKKAKEMESAPDPVAEQFFRKQQEALVGLDVVVRLRLPGDVLVWTANMEKTGEREVTARVHADQIKTPQDLVRRLAPRFEVIFDAAGTTLFD